MFVMCPAAAKGRDQRERAFGRRERSAGRKWATRFRWWPSDSPNRRPRRCQMASCSSRPEIFATGKEPNVLQSIGDRHSGHGLGRSAAIGPLRTGIASLSRACDTSIGVARHHISRPRPSGPYDQLQIVRACYGTLVSGRGAKIGVSLTAAPPQSDRSENGI